MSKLIISKPKRARNELKLPTLHFVVADDWIDKLGKEAFCAWLKLHTWVDRSDRKRECDLIPYTLESVFGKKHLNMSKSKFYRTVVRPLWNYGLIDMIEYTDYKRNTKKPINIVVYESPMNIRDAEVKPLEKIRDYDTEYKSVSQAQGRRGGRPKSDPMVSKMKRYKISSSMVSKMKRSMVSKMKPNNLNTNNLNNLNTNKQQTERVVVVREKYESLFEKKLTKKQAEDLVTLSDKHQVDLVKKMENTYGMHRVEPRKSIVAAIKYAIVNGDWDIPTSEKKISKPLPKAVSREYRPQKHTPEQLESKKLEIQRKLKMMQEEAL